MGNLLKKFKPIPADYTINGDVHTSHDVDLTADTNHEFTGNFNSQHDININADPLSLQGHISADTEHHETNEIRVSTFENENYGLFALIAFFLTIILAIILLRRASCCNTDKTQSRQSDESAEDAPPSYNFFDKFSRTNKSGNLLLPKYCGIRY
ncbi:Oidioi.mRNA.OKI2018_I69.chr2.g7800.t1.cds [Oikopleura dioica]|uniref:Oidioi.mRNA.OKI2018_I69.chr2.g7800.t1.cds n=1 Tax=Oikopleura dioica TaxID=34765 RepID=A0ABN7TC39_OIKDI|nr:Oidioi.mRNA.OKI2018_I69.chr2.g7800.t1.cds [Oikopleura dioica]